MKNLKQSPLFPAVAIVAASLALGILFDSFFFERVPGISFPLFIGLIVITLAVLSLSFHKRLSASACWLVVPLLGFASMVAVRESAPLRLMDIGACLLLLLLMARVAFRRRFTDLRIAEYLRLPLLPLNFLKPAFHTAASIITTQKAYQNQPLVGQILKGIALTVPVFVLFLLLFASADLVVQKYLASVFTFRFNEDAVARLVIVSLVTAGFVGALAYVFSCTDPELAPAAGPRKSLFGSIESTILFSSINALFLGFILVQLTYLFGGTANISAQGFTYAEYARKGFFELLAVAVAAFILLWLAERHVAVSEKGHTLLFKVLSSTLIAQVILVMASAFRRLFLYEQAYGFTALRLYSHAFTILLAVVFLILAYKIIRSASERTFAFSAFLAVIAFLAGLNLINPDAFIAQQNLTRFDVAGKIDAAYLGQLSNDAVPVLLSRYKSLPPADRDILRQELSRRRYETAEDAQNGWQSWNLSRSRAERLLKAESGALGS